MNAGVEAPVVAKSFNYNFKVKDLDGNVIDFKTFKGKTIFLNVWATWCGPCRIEMPSIQKLYDKVNRDEIVFIMLAVDDRKSFDKVVNFVKEKEYFEEEASNQIFRFKRREISCTILSEIWDGYLGFELFSKQGNMFTYYYYGGGLYRNDYDEILVKALPSIYHVTDSWENYEKMKVRIDMRYSDWRKLVGS